MFLCLCFNRNLKDAIWDKDAPNKVYGDDDDDDDDGDGDGEDDDADDYEEGCNLGQGLTK